MRSFEGDITTLVVGLQELQYHVHRDRFAARSAFFGIAAKPDWKEGRERRIPLPDDVPEVVDLYIQWVYTRSIFSRTRSDEDENTSGELDLLIDGFVFGEKIQDRQFQDASVDSLIALLSTPDKKTRPWSPSTSHADRAYRGTPEGSPLRKLMVDQLLLHGQRDNLDGVYHIDHLVDLAAASIDSRTAIRLKNPKKSTINVNNCWYHHHADDQPCYRDTGLSTPELRELW